jgi:hypothetical protein
VVFVVTGVGCRPPGRCGRSAFPDGGLGSAASPRGAPLVQFCALADVCGLLHPVGRGGAAREYWRQTLKRLLEAHGFRVVEKFPIGAGRENPYTV